MTPQSLLETVNALPADLPLVFQTGEGAVGDGYHVTELKLAQVTSIDCGGRVAAWTEAALQLLDGPGGSAGDSSGGGYMKVGKFASILSQSVYRVRGLGDSPLHVEFAHGNAGLRIYDIAVPELRDGVVAIGLQESRAQCKPAVDHAAKMDAASCCGVAATSCCA